MINIGQEIAKELKRQERTVSWLARKLNCSRSGVYRILDRNSVDTRLLEEISLILRRNFFDEFSVETSEMLSKPLDEVNNRHNV